jgi:SAM-dependent methyltransferase
MTSWHDNDAFWSDSASLIFNKQRLEAAPKEVEQAAALLQLKPGADVLDLCCGIGRHSVELARRGFRVTGVDRNAQYLARAKETAKREGLNIEWVQSDMREFRRDRAFDGAVNLLTSFGYFEDPQDDANVLANLFASLKPGGAFLMDIMGKEVMARIFREHDWREEPDGAILLEERKLRDDWNWADIRWIILHGNQRREHRFSLRLYSASDLRGMFETAGFRDVRTLGGLDGRPYDQAAERLVIVGHKPG